MLGVRVWGCGEGDSFREIEAGSDFVCGGKVRGLFPVGRQVLEISAVDGRARGLARGVGAVVLPDPLPRSARLCPSRHSDPFSRKSAGNHCNAHKNTALCSPRTPRGHGRARRNILVEFPEKSRTHPLPRAPTRSPAVGPAHSPATPQAFPCPQAHDTPPPEDTPDAQPPCATTPSEARGGPERRSLDVPKAPSL